MNTTAEALVDGKTIEVRVQHTHQYGCQLIDISDTLQLVQGASMITYVI